MFERVAGLVYKNVEKTNNQCRLESHQGKPRQDGDGKGETSRSDELKKQLTPILLIRVEVS